jgi:hypothetical protein
MPHSFSSRVTIAPDVVFRVVAAEAVILNLKTQLYLGLDSVGTCMWTALSESSSIQTAYEALLTEFDVEPELLRRDLQAFVQKLLEQRLIQVESDCGG